MTDVTRLAHHEIPPIEKREIQRLYQEGVSRTRLAAGFSCSHAAIYRLTVDLEQPERTPPLTDAERHRLLSAWTRPHVSGI